MNKISLKVPLVVLIAILALSLESCSFLSSIFDRGKELNQNQDSQPPTEVVETPVEEEEIVEEPEETEPVARVPGLIPSTDPDTRANRSDRGRQDPFSLVALRPKIENKVDPEEEKLETNPEITSTPTIETLDSPPFSQMAENVVITGVVDIGSIPKIIVRVPEEITSRYVEVGQYLSNGQILVKRIDFDRYPAPVVILEENGVEIAKEIGTEESEAEIMGSL